MSMLGLRTSDGVKNDATNDVSLANIQPPLLASIGTVLIDGFESPPRLNSSSSVPKAPAVSLNVPKSSLPSLSSQEWNDNPSTETSPASSNLTDLSTPPSSHVSLQSTPPSSIQSPESSPSITGSKRVSQSKAGPPIGTPQKGFDSGLSSASNTYDVIGGGALYALVGARPWLEPDQLRTLVDRSKEDLERGIQTDFPRDLESKLYEYGKEMWAWNENDETRTTRARIRYEGDVRIFQHVHKAPHRSFSSLLHTPLYGSEYLHVSPPYSPEDVHALSAQQDMLKQLNGEIWKPKIVFEPTPPSCHVGQKDWFERIAGGVHVLSPNHEELLSLYGHTLPKDETEVQSLVDSVVRHLIDEVGVGEEGQGIVAIRSGKMGSCVATRKGGMHWIPPYYEKDEEHMVRDVTGAGNAYLGGFVAGLYLSGGDAFEAALYGTVSASFMVEQFGLPSLTTSAENGKLWNNENPHDRLVKLKQRVTSMELTAKI